MDTTVEPPEHRACRTADLTERPPGGRAEDWGTHNEDRGRQLDALIAERHAGYDEAVRDIVEELQRLGQVDAARFVQRFQGGRTQVTQTATVDGLAPL